MTEITKSELAEILDNVFAKYGVEMVDFKTTTKKAKTPSKKVAKTEEKSTEKKPSFWKGSDGCLYFSGCFSAPKAKYLQDKKNGKIGETAQVNLLPEQAEALNLFKKGEL